MSRRALAALLAALCVLAGFAVTGALLHALVPYDAVPPLDARLHHLEHHGAGVDNLIVGSSFVQNGLSPRCFDQALAQAGLRTRTFNLGMQGMHAAELVGLVERLLKLDLPRLRYLILEPTRIYPYIATPNVDTAREIAWHNLDGFRLALSNLGCCLPLEEPAATWHRQRTKLLHIRAFVLRLLNVGRLAGHLEPAWQTRPEDGLGPAGDGFLPLVRRTAEIPNQEIYEIKLAEYSPPAVAVVPPPAPVREVLRRLESAAQARGVELIFVVPPLLLDHSDLLTAQRFGDVSTVFAFNAPSLYPDLFTLTSRFDRDHLSRRGAELWSLHLAEVFARHAGVLGQAPQHLPRQPGHTDCSISGRSG